MRVRKRDGTFQEFNSDKVRRAIVIALHAADETPDQGEVDMLVARVVEELHVDDFSTVEIDDIQNTVEVMLMQFQFPEAAKKYILYRHDRDLARVERRKPDNLALSEYIHRAKYARYVDSESRRETYDETVTRVMDMHIRNFPYLKKEIQGAFRYVYDKRVLPSMRSMQFGGIAIERDNERMYNCAYSPCDRPRFFAEVMRLLLCGCGAGYSVQWPHVDKLPPLAKMRTDVVVHHVVEDTITGWANAVDALIQASIYGYWVEFAYHLIRPEGTPLVTSGGKAPGHIPLKRCLDAMRVILLNSQGRKLRPIEASDMTCIIAGASLAGGIRRSSLIGLFSVYDTEMLYSKALGNFVPGGLNSHREMANISAVLLRDDDQLDKHFERILNVAESGYGEPGFYFTGDIDYGSNPCGEIGMHPVMHGQTGWSFCNLVEINCSLFENEQDLYEAASAASFIGTLQAAYTEMPYLGEVTEAILRRDALLGVGLMGIMDTPHIALHPIHQRTAAGIVVEENRRVADLIGINPAARCTTVKPGGTAPLEAGTVNGPVGSGITPHHARRYFRRVTANPNEHIAQAFRTINPHMVEDKPNGDWSLVFPIEIVDTAVTLKDCSAIQQLTDVKSTYLHWIVPGTTERSRSISPGLTHNVSCTISLHDYEKEDVRNFILENVHNITAMSFAPVTVDKKYPHAPREAIITEVDELKWNYMIKHYQPVNYLTIKEEKDNTDVKLEPGCSGDSCSI